MSIDLNSDLGEGFGCYRSGDDEGMLSLVTSANVACGFHAGDPEIMARTFSSALRRGVAVGAHPGYPDLSGFGRRPMPYLPDEIERIVAYQIGAAQALAHYTGHRISYVKPHGALANLAAREADVAMAISKAVRAVDPDLALLAIACSEQGPAAERCGLRVYQEVFADRGYDDAGHLMARGLPGALLEDADEAAARAVRMVSDGAIVCASGRRLSTPIHSICVHGDSTHAVGLARRVRVELERAGVTLAAFGELA